MTKDNSTLLLRHDDIASIVSRVGPDSFMSEMISRLRTAMAGYQPDDFEIPVRNGFRYQNPVAGLVEWMPLHEKGIQVFLKAVGYHPTNPANTGLPTVVSTLSRFDSRTGQATIIADGALLTAIRTGAASAVATDLLSDPNASDLGLIGCGAQAISQFHGISLVRDLKTVRLYDTDEANAASFEERIAAIRPIGVDVEICGRDEVVRESSILCTATSVGVNQGPVLEDVDVRSNLHVNAVGSDMPGKIEIPKTILKRSLVVPDFLDQAVIEGECQQLRRDEIGPSILSVAANPDLFKPRQNSLTVFDSTGWTLEDSVALELALQHASTLKIGSRLQLSASKNDPWNPYDSLFADSLQPSSVSDDLCK